MVKNSFLNRKTGLVFSLKPALKEGDRKQRKKDFFIIKRNP
jgi:hypothetical protein